MSPAASGPAARLVAALAARGLTLAVAESLTGGLVSASIVDVPGASRVLRGAVVAYATDVKHTVLGVPAERLARTGPVDVDVAIAMAEGARTLLGCDVGLATTGVAGPGPADGWPAGTVVVAVAVTGRAAVTRSLHLDGDRDRVRAGAVDAVLALLLHELGA